MSSFYTSVPKLMIIGYTVVDIRCVKDVIVVFSFWAIFCPIAAAPPPNSPKNDNFNKMRKTTGDIIILHKYQKS